MSQKKQANSVPSHAYATSKGADASLSIGSLKSLTGFFDVLIQMDFEQQLKQRTTNEETINNSTKANDTDNSR